MILIVKLEKDAEDGIFEKAEFQFGGVTKKYNPILNWFDSKKNFEIDPEKIEFRCIICGFKSCHLIGEKK